LVPGEAEDLGERQQAASLERGVEPEQEADLLFELLTRRFCRQLKLSQLERQALEGRQLQQILQTETLAQQEG
jgi:hypothetical protein